MKYFRDYLREEFNKDKEYEKAFYKGLEKARIAAEIIYYREKNALTQSNLAEMIKSSQPAIARLENPDYRGYSIKVLRKIAEALDLELVVTFRNKLEVKESKRGFNVIKIEWPKKEFEYKYQTTPILINTRNGVSKKVVNL